MTPQAQNYDFGHRRTGKPVPFGRSSSDGTSYVTLKELKGSSIKSSMGMSDTDSVISYNDLSNDLSKLETDENDIGIDEAEYSEGEAEEREEREEREREEMEYKLEIEVHDTEREDDLVERESELVLPVSKPRRSRRPKQVELVPLRPECVIDEW